MVCRVIAMGLALMFGIAGPASGKTFVGVAKVDVTPTHPTLLAGYGGRTTPHEGVDAPLWGRVLTLKWDEGEPFVVIAVDNCGVPANVVEKIAKSLKDGHAIERARLVVASTHTHNAPTLRGYAPIVWSGRATPAQEMAIDRYTDWLTGQLVEATGAALSRMQTATVRWGQGRVSFGGNRRVMRDGKWAGFGLQPQAPVDHSLPVLVADDVNGKPLAIWSNYACHCTTVGSRNSIGGDWAGFANAAMEQQHPTAIALTTIGCGADVGPQPSGNLELARRHGEAIAQEVRRVITQPLQSLDREPLAKRRQIQLPFVETPTRDSLQRRTQGRGFDAEHARYLLAQWEREGQLPKSLDYVMTTWSFGKELGMVFLPGEVVVDYAVRLKSELDWRRLWINGWSNDVPCYIPSKRVLAEGGYESDFSQIYYARPSRFEAGIEDRIVGAVKEMLGDTYESPDSAAPSFLRRPTSLQHFQRHWRTELPKRLADAETETALRRMVTLSAVSQNGFSRLLTTDPQEDSWFDYSGTQSVRPYIRQQREGSNLVWETAAVRIDAGATHVVFAFAGGAGWRSNPQTAGFQLKVNGEQALQFDVANRARQWSSSDKLTRLHFVPTWTSTEDAAGVFYLEIPVAMVTAGKPCQLTVVSLGQGSQRWFSLNSTKEVKAIERVVRESIK